MFFTHKGAGGWHSDLDITDTQWHFIAVTLDHQTLKFYIDGKPAGQAAMGYSIDSQGSLYCLGGTLDDPGSTFLGSLAETLVFNRPLGPAEIAELYNQMRGADRDGLLFAQVRGAERYGKLAGLVAGYHFGEGQGIAVADFSGHGNNATLHGGVAWVPGARGDRAGGAGRSVRIAKAWGGYLALSERERFEFQPAFERELR